MSVMKIIGNKTAVRLLKALFENPLHEFKEIDLIKKADTGKGSAISAINCFLEEHILIERKIGKARIVNLNMKNRQAFLLKNLFDGEKLFNIEKNKLACLLLFKNKVHKDSNLIVVFGSSVVGNANENSDIDILIVGDNLDKINKARKEVEEVFGERVNIHLYDGEKIHFEIRKDVFLQNSFLRGIIVHGYDLGYKLFSSFSVEIEFHRLFFLYERINAARRNYFDKDYKTSREVLEKTLEQLIFFILSYKKIGYESKRDAIQSILNLPEGKIFKKINSVQLKEKISLTEELILNILKKEILEEEGYVYRGD